MNTRFFLVILLALFGASCTQAPEERASRGAELLAPFKANLKSALVAGMADGPAAAIDVCSIEAPEIAAELSVDGVRMGRSSDRLRNPRNVPPEWLEPILEHYASNPGSRSPQTVSIADGRTGYAEPIMIQPLCLTCHGKALHPDVVAQIGELYPDDRATGYEAGDFRGVFWVEF